METARCKAFLSAVEEGNMTKAAEKLGYTPSGVSQLITALEDDLGLKLLALVLAIIVFYAVRDSMSTTRLYTGQPLFGAPAITEGAD